MRKQVLSAGAQLDLDLLVPAGFVPPRKTVSSESLLEKQGFKRGTSPIFFQYKTFQPKRDIISGVHCYTWGCSDDSSVSLFILIQKTKEEFDFLKRFSGISVLNSKWILLEEWSWGSTLLDTLQVLIRTSDSSNITICSAQSLCWPVLTSTNIIRNRTKSPILRLVFLSPPIFIVENSESRNLIGLNGVHCYLELDVRNSRLEEALRGSPMKIMTNNDMSLLDFLRLENNSDKPSIILSQFIPSENEVAENDEVFQKKVQYLVVRQIETRNDEIFILVWCSTQKKILKIPFPPSELKPKIADVLRLDGNGFTVLRKDEPVRAHVLRMASQFLALPVVSVQNIENLTLSKLCACNASEGRSNLKVQVLKILGSKNVRLIVRDDSLEQGFFCSISFANNQNLHKIQDFKIGCWFDLLLVRIERDNFQNFRAILDNTSRTRIIEEPSPSQVKRSRLTLSTVSNFCGSQISVGEYRIQATVKDVVFYGYSWKDIMSHWQNVFQWKECMFEFENNEWRFRDFYIELGDKKTEPSFLVKVMPHSANEVLPFISSQTIGVASLEHQHHQLMIVRQVINSLINEQNEMLDFALYVNSNYQYELISIDI